MPKGIRLGGRQKGTPNKVTPEIRTLTRNLFTKDYWARVQKQALAGELNPKIEALLLTYAYGSPVHESQGQTGLIVNIGFLGPAPANAGILRLEPQPAESTCERLSPQLETASALSPDIEMTVSDDCAEAKATPNP